MTRRKVEKAKNNVSDIFRNEPKEMCVYIDRQGHKVLA